MTPVLPRVETTGGSLLSEEPLHQNKQTETQHPTTKRGEETKWKEMETEVVKKQ